MGEAGANGPKTRNKSNQNRELDKFNQNLEADIPLTAMIFWLVLTLMMNYLKNVYSKYLMYLYFENTKKHDSILLFSPW